MWYPGCDTQFWALIWKLTLDRVVRFLNQNIYEAIFKYLQMRCIIYYSFVQLSNHQWPFFINSVFHPYQWWKASIFWLVNNITVKMSSNQKGYQWLFHLYSVQCWFEISVCCLMKFQLSFARKLEIRVPTCITFVIDHNSNYFPVWLVLDNERHLRSSSVPMCVLNVFVIV